MLSRAALLALLATPALARDVTTYAYGTGLDGPCVLTLARCPDDSCWATVELENHLVQSAWGPHDQTATLTLEGVSVVVTVVAGAERVPEVLVVTPPLGFLVDVPELVVEDDGEGVVRILAPLVG